MSNQAHHSMIEVIKRTPLNIVQIKQYLLPLWFIFVTKYRLKLYIFINKNNIKIVSIYKRIFFSTCIKRCVSMKIISTHFNKKLNLHNVVMLFSKSYNFYYFLYTILELYLSRSL